MYSAAVVNGCACRLIAEDVLVVKVCGGFCRYLDLKKIIFSLYRSKAEACAVTARIDKDDIAVRIDSVYLLNYGFKIDDRRYSVIVYRVGSNVRAVPCLDKDDIGQVCEQVLS